MDDAEYTNISQAAAGMHQDKYLTMIVSLEGSMEKINPKKASIELENERRRTFNFKKGFDNQNNKKIKTITSDDRIPELVDVRWIQT